MAITLESFAADCHAALKSQPGTARSGAGAQAGEAGAGRPGIRRDLHPAGHAGAAYACMRMPNSGFAILAHGYVGPKGSKPHDHGPSWAIYGQAAGETIMTDWECLARPTDGAPGKASAIRDYVMKPGDAYLYDVGVLHSPERKGDTRLLRIEGLNMAKVKRFPYEAVGRAAE